MQRQLLMGSIGIASLLSMAVVSAAEHAAWVRTDAPFKRNISVKGLSMGEGAQGLLHHSNWFQYNHTGPDLWVAEWPLNLGELAQYGVYYDFAGLNS